MIDEEKNHNFRVGDHAKALLTINIEDNPTENDAEDKLTSKLADLEWNGKEDKEKLKMMKCQKLMKMILVKLKTFNLPIELNC